MARRPPFFNVRLIASYLWEYPGARTSDIRRMMFVANGVPMSKFSSGYYTYPFRNSQGYYDKRTPMKGRFWEKRDGGWYLTQQGLAYVQASSP